MCGIVGILGREAVAGQLVDALKRLEYRGYDSAGIATLVDGKIERRRAEGKLGNLAARLAAAPLSGVIGIAQTVHMSLPLLVLSLSVVPALSSNGIGETDTASGW